MPPKRSTGDKRKSTGDKRKRHGLEITGTIPKHRKSEPVPTKSQRKGAKGSNTESLLKSMVESVAEMQNQIKELQRAQQTHVVSNTVGPSVRTLVSKLPQQEHCERQENGKLSKATSNGNSQAQGRERNPINQATVADPSSDSEAELLDIIPPVTKEMTDTLTGKGTLQAAPINNVAISSTDLDSELLASAHISLSTMIKPSIKADIWSNKYVDLSLLIAPEQQSTYELVCEQPDCDNNFAPKLKWSQKNAFAIKNIHQWTDAFNTFIAIYCERFPGEASNLMKYMSTVRNIARKKGDWVQYDTKFRKLRELQPSLGWQVVQSELYQEARLEFIDQTIAFPKRNFAASRRGRNQKGYDMKSSDHYRDNSSYSRFSNFRPFSGNYASNSQYNGERSYDRHSFGTRQSIRERQPFRREQSPCWRYNRGKYCWGCSRVHACSYCKADHPRRDCPLLASRNHRSPSPGLNTNKAKHPKKVAK